MTAVTAIFDIGKTNKKLLLFTEEGEVVSECSESLPEIADEDGFPCEDISLLKQWIFRKWNEVIVSKEYSVGAVNFSAYGASFVHLDENDKVCAPLYNYLKSYPPELLEQFYSRYGDKNSFAEETASPPMGFLNSGLQLYWLKHRKQEVFGKINTSLHLPQYLSWLFSGKKLSEHTSIGCHTALWNFKEGRYHRWLEQENLSRLLPPLSKTESVEQNFIKTGVGLHDSSAALLPYVRSVKEPFLLLSTGTWCVCMNPFDSAPVNASDLSLDCLCYMNPTGKAVKASRIFLGKEHEYQVRRMNAHFTKQADYYKTIATDQYLKETRRIISGKNPNKLVPACLEGTGPFPDKKNGEWNLNSFETFEQAYSQLLLDLSCMLK
ncbi:MAG: FGGY-family carbohydrate kinase, partial [Cytophagaceae bacterium]